MTAESTHLFTCCILHVLEFRFKLHETNKSKRLVVVDQHHQQSAKLHVSNYNFTLLYLPLIAVAYSVGIMKPQFIAMFATQGPCLKTFANNSYLHTLTLWSILNLWNWNVSVLCNDGAYRAVNTQPLFNKTNLLMLCKQKSLFILRSIQNTPMQCEQYVEFFNFQTDGTQSNPCAS